jgi:hypothetical protein
MYITISYNPQAQPTCKTNHQLLSVETPRVSPGSFLHRSFVYSYIYNTSILRATSTAAPFWNGIPLGNGIPLWNGIPSWNGIPANSASLTKTRAPSTMVFIRFPKQPLGILVFRRIPKQHLGRPKNSGNSMARGPRSLEIQMPGPQEFWKFNGQGSENS